MTTFDPYPMKKSIIALAFGLYLSSTLNAQNVGVGADVMYNFQTESFGVGGRVSFFPNSVLSIVPQISYYPGFNKVHEYYAGLSLEYKVIRQPKYHIYAIGHAAYNNWINYSVSAMDGAKQSNWNAEVGGGISTNKCLRPFLEYRYNFKFLETHLRLGILYIFGCKGGNGSGYKKGGKNKGLCPAYG